LLAVSFLIGYFFHSLIKTKQKDSLTIFALFANLVVGLVILISTYSIIITSGKTVNWIFILLLAGYGYFIKVNATIDNTPIITRSYLKFGLSLLIVSFILYFIYLSSLLNFKLLIFTDTFCDWQYYSKTSQYLNLGFESTGQFDNIAFGITFTPYHYFEIWLAALTTKIFDIPSQISISIIMPTMFGCIAFIGVLGFATKLNYRNAVLAFLLLFISGVTFFSSFLNRVGLGLPLIAGDISSVVSYFKLYPILIFLILSFHYLVQKNYLVSLCCLLFVPVASFVLFPSVFPALWIAIIYLFYKKSNTILTLRFVFFLIVYALIFICYYFFFWDTNYVNNILSFQEFKSQLHSITNPLLLLFDIFPFFLFVFILKKDVCIENGTKNELIISYFLLLFISIGIYLLTISNYDGIQFFSNLFIPLSTTIISLFLIRLKINNKRTNFIAHILFVLLLISSVFYSVKYIILQKRVKHESVFIQQIIEKIKPKTSKPIYCGFIHSEQYYSEYYMHSLSKIFRSFEVMDCYFNNLLEVGISDYVALDWLENKYFGDIVKKKQGLSRIPEGTFYKFVENQKRERKFKSIEDSQIYFLEKFKIKYIFIQNNAVVSNELSKKCILIASEKDKNGYSLYKII